MILLALLSLLSCSSQQAATIDTPTFYAADLVSQVRAHVNQGYGLLGADSLDEAVAEFAKIGDLIQGGVTLEYHTACAYGRTGDKESAFKYLNQLIDHGYDSPRNLQEDGDLASLTDDPRFEKILTAAAANKEAGKGILSSGMPDYDKAPMTFATEEEFDTWVKDQKKLIRSHGIVWTSTENSFARMDFAAQKLAVLREMKSADAEFDYGLERVNEAASLSSLYETWGIVTDIVMKEVKNYSGKNTNEVNYRAGLALSMKHGEDDSERSTSYGQAASYLAKVEEGTEYYGAAQTLTLVNQLRLPGADEAKLGPELQQLAAQFKEDDNAYRIISTQFGPRAVNLTWPIPIDKPDLDNKQINLADYKGKVLLVDFWATWCGPCLAELPKVLETYEQFHPQGFEIVSISLDYSDRKSQEEYKTWIDEKGMNWRHTYDGNGWKTELVRRYFVSSIPATFLVGPDGSLIAWGDDLRGENLATTVEKALAKMGS